jgi:hypothetical protein
MRSFTAYSSKSTIRMIKPRRMRMVGHVARMGRTGLFVGKPEGKRPLESSNVDEENIKIDLCEIAWGCMDWIGLA